MTKFIFTIWAGLLMTSFGDAERIIEQNVRQRIADLQAYIEANPQARDLDIAYAALVEDFERLSEDDKAFAARIDAYRWSVESDMLDLSAIFGQHVRPIAEAMQTKGNRMMGREFLLQVRKDFLKHRSYPQISIILDQLDEQFHGVGIGDHPPIKFVDLQGKEHDLIGYRGKVVLVDFWSHTEKSNLVLISGLQAAFEKHGAAGFEIFSLSEDNSPVGLHQYLRKAEMPWVHALDKKPGNEIADQLGVTSTPKNFLFDQEGKIVAKNVYGKELMRKVERLLAE